MYLHRSRANQRYGYGSRADSCCRLSSGEVLYFYPEMSEKVFTVKEFVWGVSQENQDIGDHEAARY
jgi:hypothetical protein